jgi:DNA-binding SARP family transcriptional activator
MNQLVLRFFGEPAVIYNRQVIHFPTRKALALFIYLVVEGETQPREKLMTLLWPESDTGSAQASLRNELARLRRTLSVAGPIVVAQKGSVCFQAPQAYTLDLQLVQTAVASLPNKTQSVETAVWQTALDAYEAPFLATFSLPYAPDFDLWLTVQQERYHRQVSLIFAHLAQHQLAQHQLAAAVATATRWVSHDALEEAATRCLMQAHFLSGDRRAALQAYQSYQAALATGLGMAPAPEIVQLAETIENSSQRQQQLKGKRPSSPAKTTLPLVGRSQEYAHLVAAYQAVSNGHTQAVIVTGEIGIGKTHLIQDFLDWVVVQGGDILTGRAYEVSERLPYQPITDALRTRLHRENAPDDLLDDIWLAELARLLPELRDRYPDLPEALTTDKTNRPLAQPRLFEAIFRMGEAWGRRQTIVWFIDDWQWADHASFDLLHYLGRHWTQHKTPLLLLLAVRSETLTGTTLITRWLTDWERHMPISTLWLTPLTLAETEYLVSIWAEVAPDAPGVHTFSQRLFAETMGQPFFMVETLKLLAEEMPSPAAQGAVDLGDLTQKLAVTLPLPPSVRKAILTHLGRLDEMATRLLTAASVLGRDCHFAELCQLSGVTEWDGLLALDALLAGQLLVETDGQERPYAFSHDQIRDVVYTEAGHARRRVYHERAIAVLEAAAAPASELAHHALAARLAVPAFRYSLQAGDDALQLLALYDAIDHYEAARQIAIRESRTMQLETADYQRLYLGLGRALELSEHHEAASQIYTELVHLAKATVESSVS